MKNGTLLRQVINRINRINRINDDIDFNDSKKRHLFGDIYEQILKDLQSAGNAGEYYTPDETFLLNQRVGKLEFIEVDPDFAHLYLATQVQENLRISAGSAIPNLSTGQINEMAFPVAPLSEQKRIVSKVTHLLSQVTRLESTLTRREATRTQLLTAAIHAILTPDDLQ